MQNLQKGSIALSIFIIFVVSLGGYFLIKNTTKEEVFNSIDNYSIISPEASSESIIITFPKQGSVLAEGETYEITWVGPKISPVGSNPRYVVVLEFGGGGGFTINNPKDISVGSVSWSVPSSMQVALCCGDVERKVTPDDDYRINIYEFTDESIETSKVYSSGVFKIVPKMLQ